MRDRHHKSLWLTMVAAALIQVGDEPTADACGCLSPPAPISNEAYAVNQRAEQIIFEVEPGWVTAHVLIKYSGSPEKFAWLIPVPEIPELAISPTSAFGLLDQLTAPDTGVDVQNICPVSAWSCNYHEQQVCQSSGWGAGGIDDNSPPSVADAGTGGGTPGGVTVIDQKVVGDYETVTFRATEAALASQWLNDNGFIVNPTTTIYMESYVQQNMVFVAAKLVAGAGISAIKPLRLKYRAPFPMVPLVLTAVAADPHLTVNTFIFGDKPFRPMGHPMVTIDTKRIAQDTKGRANYPMVLARTIDESGGDGFAAEYRGSPVRPEFGGQSFCCGNSFDSCGIGNNNTCECPRDEFDRADCQALGDLVEGVAFVDDLATRHGVLTRLTTRVSAEEMTFDPTFEPDFNAPQAGKLSVRGKQLSLTACADAVVESNRGTFASITAQTDCSSLYCGLGSQCVTTAAGAACACAAGQVAQQFSDVDNVGSVTCVPKVPPVDLRAGGLQLPDACAGVSCGSGQCIDRNGVAVCECDSTAAAVVTTGAAPSCLAVVSDTQTPGAQNYAQRLETIQVCAPAPPVCESGGWLTKGQTPRPGVDCGGTEPDPLRTVVPPKIDCESFWGCGCQGGGEPLGSVLIGGALAALLVGKRRRAGARR